MTALRKRLVVASGQAGAKHAAPLQNILGNLGSQAQVALRRVRWRWWRSEHVFRHAAISPLGALNLFGEMEFVQNPDTVPVEVHFIPAQAVASGSRMRVMIVVPAFAEGDHGDPKIVGGRVARNETARAPEVRGGIDEPGEMQTKRGAQENSPQHTRPATNRIKRSGDHNNGDVMVFGNPDVE